MVRRLNGRLPWLIGCVMVIACAIAMPATAQSTGMVKGVVKDMQGQPVDGAKVTIEMSEGTSRKFETKSNKKGEFIQIGLPSGRYTVTAEKDKQLSNAAPVQVRINTTAEANLIIGAPNAAAASKEAVAKNAELKSTLEAGLAASNAGNDDEAIAKFLHAAELKPDCADCFYNVALLQAKKKDYAKSEEMYKKAIELRSNYADAYNGLANIYNAQRKFDLTDLIVVEPVPAQLEQVLNFELGILPGVRHRYYRRTLTAWPLESTTKAKSWEIHAMPTSAAVPSFGKTIR